MHTKGEFSPHLFFFFFPAIDKDIQLLKEKKKKSE